MLNKFCCIVNIVFVFFFCTSLCVCGLDEYYVLDEPAIRNTFPTVDTTDELLKNFSFKTSKNSDSGAFNYVGTAIYYRIYNNKSTLSSHISNIDNLNKADNMDAAAKAIINTYKYQPLGTSGGKTEAVLLGAEYDGTLVDIRLHNYHEYKRHISTDGAEWSVYPMRNGDLKSFHFNPNSKDRIDVLPEEGDEDLEYGSATKSGRWYVNAYAFAKGRDANFNDVCSLVLHLGTIVIDESDFD